MRVVFIGLLLVFSFLVGCSKVTDNNAKDIDSSIEQIRAAENISTLVVDDPSIDAELILDSLDKDIGTLDELPIDENIPE